MLKRLTQLAVTLAVAVPSVVCAQQALTPPGGTDVAARIGDRVITVKELDENWRNSEPAEQARATQALYDGRRQALDRIIADMLIEQAAKAKGIPASQFLQEDLGRRMRPVTDADITSFYEQNKARMQGKPLEEMRGAIRDFLAQQQEAAARRALLTELRASAPAVRVSLDPPRTTVEVDKDDPSRGPANAPVVIVEFSDYQCPFCARVVPTLSRIREAYGDKVRIVWKDFPLTSIHPQAFKASEAAHCAGDQGKYWEYHDRLFTDQRALQVDSLRKYATDLGLDASKFNACLDSGKYGDKVREGLQLAAKHGLESTPSIFINGRLVMGAQPFEAFQAVIEDELQRAGK